MKRQPGHTFTACPWQSPQMAQLWEGKNWGWIWQRGFHRPEPSISAPAPGEMPALASAGKRAAENPLRRQAAKRRLVKRQAAKCQAAKRRGKCTLCNTCAPTKAVNNNRWRRNPRVCAPFYSEGGARVEECVCAVTQDATPGGKAQQCRRTTTVQGHTTPVQRPYFYVF